jgi:hypothetical protein
VAALLACTNVSSSLDLDCRHTSDVLMALWSDRACSTLQTSQCSDVTLSAVSEMGCNVRQNLCERQGIPRSSTLTRRDACSYSSEVPVIVARFSAEFQCVHV